MHCEAYCIVDNDREMVLKLEALRDLKHRVAVCLLWMEATVI